MRRVVRQEEDAPSRGQGLGVGDGDAGDAMAPPRQPDKPVEVAEQPHHEAIRLGREERVRRVGKLEHRSRPVHRSLSHRAKVQLAGAQQRQRPRRWCMNPRVPIGARRYSVLIYEETTGLDRPRCENGAMSQNPELARLRGGL